MTSKGGKGPPPEREIETISRNNQRQNKQVADAARGEGLNNEQRRRLGRIIEEDHRRHGISHDYRSIRRVARELKEGKL